MAKEIDEKVVSMKFDNKHFMEHTSETMSRLDKLKNSLRLPGISKGLEEVGNAANGIKLNPLGAAAEQVSLKFNALQVMATTALMNITNSAVNAGKRIVAAFTIDPIKTGLQEYETQINAVQTILANTSSKGTTLDQVNNALDELNHYADMTIYNFTEMTRNIGTFTAAGVDLDTSVSAIKGIANLAAVSGSTSQQASTAMYQLSQALAAGKVQLMDWNSVVNAGMGGQVFQDALKETARVDGIAIDDMIEKHGSFRETLQEGWLTSEVLTKTLAKFTGDLSEEQLKQMGYSEEQIKEIIKLGQTANDAATKVKTFTQLMDTLKEAAQSGWTQTWEILIGDFEEAKKLWTSVSDYFSDALNKSAEARNNMLQAWADAGGREMVIETFKNTFQGLLSIIKPIKEAFREIFPRTTADQLLQITKRIKEITSGFKLSEKTSENLKNTFKGLFAILDIGLTVIKSVVSAASKLFGNVTDLSGGILGVTGALGNYVSGLRDSIKESGTFGNILGKIAEILNAVFKRFIEVLGAINKKLVAPGFKWFYSLLTGIWKVLQWIGGKIKDVLSNVASGLKEAFQNGDLANATTLLSGGVLVAILVKFKKFIDGFKNPLKDLSGIFDSVKGVFDSVGDALKAWQQELQAKTLLKIAGAIAILAGSILIISTIDNEKLATSLGAITALFAELMGAMAIFAKIAGPIKGVVGVSVAMISMSTSVLILASALKILSNINGEDLTKSLVGLAATFAILLGALSYMSKIDKMGKGAGKLLVIANSLVIFAAALKILATMGWPEIGKSLTAMAATFAILLSALAIMSKIDQAGKGAGKLLVISVSLVIFASGLKILATMGWEEIGKSLTAMAGTFAILLAAMAVMSKLNTFNLGAASILVMSASLILIATALKIVGSMGWENIAKSLTGIGATLALMVSVLTVMASIGPMSLVGAAAMVVMAAAINLLVPPLVALGLLSWESIIKGLVTLGAAFVIIGTAGYLLAPVVPVIIALAGALALVGVATLAFGIGLIAVGAGLTSLSVALTAGAASIVAGLTIIIQGIIGLIPAIIAAIGQGIILIAKTIAGSVGAITSALVAVIVALCDAIIQSVPKIVTAAGVLLDALLKFIVSYAPKLISAGIKLILALLDGIAQNIDKVVEKAVLVVTKFLEGLSSQIPVVIAAAFDFILDFINGIGDAIETYTPQLMEACVNLGTSIVQGVVKGMVNIPGAIWNGIVSVGNIIKNGFRKIFNMHSPSKVTEEYGKFLDEGMAIGLTKYKGSVGDATEDVGKTAIDSMSNAISGISDAIDSDIDGQPTIRPVLDLSDIQAGAGSINDMFGMTPSVDVLSNVGSINSMMNKNQNGGNSDVISAINKLGKQIQGNQGNVYNVNGVTYDDGSNVADAVGSLVRAAKIERRI